LLDLSLNCSVTLPEAGDRFGFVDRKEGEAASAHLPQGVVSFSWPVRATLERHEASIASDALFAGLAADYYALVCSSNETWPHLERSVACAKADRLYTRLLKEEAKPQSCVRYLSFLKSATPEYSRREEPQLRQCLREWPADADLLLYDALYHYRVRRPKEAIQQAMRSAENNKDRKRAAQALGFAASVAFETEEYARSAELYKKAVAADATNPRYLEGQITALLFADKPVLAAKEFHEAIKRHGDIPPVAIDLIRRAYADLDKHDAFISAATPLAGDAKIDLLKRVLMYRSIALAQIDLGKRVEARHALEKGIHLTEKLSDDRRESLLAELRRILGTIESK
jgi:tetratricopeptide (TPR) repeat protein